MHKLTFFPIGNADCCLVDLAGGHKLLFDYANCPDTADASDKRIDLAAALRADLKAARRRDFDVVAFTHADDDHVRGMSEFFHLDHAAKYQGEDRIRIGQLWVPAAVIVEDGLDGDARVLQAEARYRFKRGTGIRIFSRPDALKDWCADNGISWADRQHLMTDAGQLVPEFVKSTHGVEFFVHSPFAVRLPDGKVVDRNDCSLVLQATFTLNGRDTRLILSADTTWENFVPMVNITRAHGRAHRLEWDIFKLPHHCSYLSLSDKKGKTITTPVDEVGWLFEDQGADGAIAVSCSDPIPTDDTDQPPHRQAANYYRELVAGKRGQFKVTMEHPTVRRPEPLVITIDRFGPTPKKPTAAASTIVTGQQAPRAGSDSV